jgi:glycosyltransferase involved in cell wall biosynthesis
MRIAQVAPLYESVPPKLYGGTERVVSYLTEELVRLGHDVTLFAAGDSVTHAELAAVWPRALRLDPSCRDERIPHVLQLERVLQRANEFDVIHYHVDANHYPTSRRSLTPQLTTLHSRLDLPHLQPLYTEFKDMPVVSISNSQRKPLPQAAWCGTVYHGLPLSLHRLWPGPGEYFAFLGRVSPEKGVDRAIQIAKRLGVPLKIAAKIDLADAEYFQTQIVPQLDPPRVEFIGEIGESEKGEFLGRARALLFPIDWPEPFGLVIIEAMACGTPVVAMRHGSVPELIDQGIAGFHVDSLDDAVNAAARITQLDRRACRAAFERRFSAARMARDYVAVYEDLIDGAKARSAALPASVVAAE